MSITAKGSPDGPLPVRILYITFSPSWIWERHKLAYILRVFDDAEMEPLIKCSCRDFARGVCKHILALSVRIARAERHAQSRRNGGSR